MNEMTEQGVARINVKIELETEILFYTNGEDWLVKISLYDNNNQSQTLCFQLASTHNHRFNESMLVKIPYNRFIDIINNSTFKRIDMNSRIDWSKMEVLQEKIKKEENEDEK